MKFHIKLLLIALLSLTFYPSCYAANYFYNNALSKHVLENNENDIQLLSRKGIDEINFHFSSHDHSSFITKAVAKRGSRTVEHSTTSYDYKKDKHTRNILYLAATPDPIKVTFIKDGHGTVRGRILIDDSLKSHISSSDLSHILTKVVGGAVTDLKSKLYHIHQKKEEDKPSLRHKIEDKAKDKIKDAAKDELKDRIKKIF